MVLSLNCYLNLWLQTRVWLTEYDWIVNVLIYFLLLSGQISYQSGKIITREELEKILAKEKPAKVEVMALGLETHQILFVCWICSFWYFNGDRHLYPNIFWDITWFSSCLRGFYLISFGIRVCCAYIYASLSTSHFLISFYCNSKRSRSNILFCFHVTSLTGNILPNHKFSYSLLCYVIHILKFRFCKTRSSFPLVLLILWLSLPCLSLFSSADIWYGRSNGTSCGHRGSWCELYYLSCLWQNPVLLLCCGIRSYRSNAIFFAVIGWGGWGWGWGWGWW